jgi:hypothetical protein
MSDSSYDSSLMFGASDGSDPSSGSPVLPFIVQGAFHEIYTAFHQKTGSYSADAFHQMKQAYDYTVRTVRCSDTPTSNNYTESYAGVLEQIYACSSCYSEHKQGENDVAPAAEAALMIQLRLLGATRIGLEQKRLANWRVSIERSVASN